MKLALAALLCAQALPGWAQAWPEKADASIRACPAPVLDKVLAATPAVARPADEWRLSVCRAAPAQPGMQVAVVATRAETPETLNLVVALVDAASARVTALHHHTLEEDAALSGERMALRIDGAAYPLSATTVAFGVDLYGGYHPHCGDGFMGATRSVYAVLNGQLRPVLSKLPLSWGLITGNRHDRCGDPSKAGVEPDPRVDETRVTLQVAPTTSHGLRDIRVTETTRRTDRPSASVQRAQRVLKFDGSLYQVYQASR